MQKKEKEEEEEGEGKEEGADCKKQGGPET